MRNNAYLNDQREEVAGPSAKPSTMYEQLEKPIGPKKGGSSHAAAKKPKETFHGSDVNATHFPSRVGQLQKGLQQDIHPARQNDGGQCIPTTKGNRAAVFFVDERQYFVRLPHNKIKRFPSATTITPAYIESLEENSGSLYRGGSCNHSTCHLPDHMIGWSQYLGDYSVCPRRFDPELHKVLNPRSINRLAFEAYEHFQAAHRNEEAVLFYDFPTTRRSSVDMVEMPTSLVIFVERLTAFEVQQILIGKLDIDWSGAQGWYLLPRNVFIPKYDLWTDKYVAAPCRVSGYDAFGKFPLEDPGEFLDRLTDSAYNAFLQGQVTAARCPEGWCLVSVPWAARHRYGLVSVMDMSNEELTGAADGTKESALSTKGKNKHRALEGEKAIVTSFIDAHVPYLWLEEDISHLPAFKTSTQVPATTNSLDDRKPQAADLPSLTIKPKNSKKNTPLTLSTTHTPPVFVDGEPSHVPWSANCNKIGPNRKSLGGKPKRSAEKPPKGLPSLGSKHNSQAYDYVDCGDCGWSTANFGSSRATKNPPPTVARHSTVTIHPTATRRLTGGKYAELLPSLYQGAGADDWFYID
ncbi:hypothetical protein PMIN06_008653 [Paraphaeosphaeria minitans]